MELLQEIEERSKDISTDSLSMSIGEVLSMYRDGELILRPEFQRFFRWTPEQKSRLVESILLGIPLPSIFVSQLEDGRWEVVDGLQRLSTLFELTGELRGEDGEKKAALQLTRTKYLPSLEGLRWDGENGDQELPDPAKLKIKRSRLDMNIVLSSSDVSAKYELFQRLNTGGSQATEQEVRNAILVMVNRNFFSWLHGLAQSEAFRSCIPLTERALEEQFDLELVTRFLVFRQMSSQDLKSIDELGQFLTDRIVAMAEDVDFDRTEAGRAFLRTFKALADTLGEGSFKKYDQKKRAPSGAMLISIFEALAVGIGSYAGNPDYEIDNERIVALHQKLPQKIGFTTPAGSGIRASTRIPNTIALGREALAP